MMEKQVKLAEVNEALLLEADDVYAVDPTTPFLQRVVRMRLFIADLALDGQAVTPPCSPRELYVEIDSTSPTQLQMITEMAEATEADGCLV